MAILAAVRNAFKIQELRKRILFTLGVLVVFRIGAHIPLPGINPTMIEQFQKDAGDAMGGLFAMIQVFSGGALGNLALFSLGIMPYITASIIMQLMTKVSPTLEAMVKEGPGGQRKISQYTRYLAIPICLVQGFFAAQQITQYSVSREMPLVVNPGFGSTFMMVMALTAGALFIMWLGEQISENGLGNGASVLIMAGIVARMPSVAGQLVQGARDDQFHDEAVLGIALMYIGVIVATVFVTQAQRRIPIQHAKHFRGRRVWMGSRNYMPLKVNTAGVMPVIFASSLLILPQLISMIPGLGGVQQIFRPGQFIFTVFYMGMIFFFAYFWTYLFFQPHEMANNLKEYGSFIPGIRPGEVTAKYLDSILARITLCGAAFLCAIALIPDLAGAALGLNRWLVAFLGGTGILIIVGVALDIVQKTEGYLTMHNYGGFLSSGSVRGRR